MPRRPLLLAAALVLGLAACGGGDDAAAPTTVAVTAAASSTSTAPTSTASSSTSTTGASSSTTAATVAPSSAPPTAATTRPTARPTTAPPSTAPPTTPPSTVPPTTAPPTTQPTTVPPTTSTSRTPQGFGVLGVTIRDAGGASRSFCLWLADTAAKHQQGLMQVTDLGGKAGMIFTYSTNSTGAFWMFQTVMPLSIAFFDEQGTFVSSADMQPCPSTSNTCVTYPALGPYRDAIEVPLGALASMGIGPGSAIVGRGSCPA